MKKILMILMMTIMSFNFAIATNVTYNKSVIECVKVNIPAVLKFYSGDSVQVQIRTKYKYLQDNIRYRIDDKNRMINIWIENYNAEDINNLESKNIQIAIVAPKELKIKTNNNFLLTSHSTNKKNSAVSYENN